MDIKVRTLSGGDHSTLSVNDRVFFKKYNEALIHQVVTSHMKGARQGSKAQKTRSEVSGGGAKPWRQKGTGRARAGTIRSPIFRKGGVTFAAKPKNYKNKVNRKMYRVAICSILSTLLSEDRILVVDSIKCESRKTKNFILQFKPLKLDKALVIVSDSELSEELYFSSRNIRNIELLNASDINPVTLIRFDKVVATVGAIKKIEELFL